ncbi:MAG: hypothetical protein HY071_00585 [Chloroflexi bacterium]|nr:hypothetical protein [Chloroflexota bacterium]
MSRRRLEEGLAVAFGALLLVADAVSLDLFASLAGTTLALLALYALTRPALAGRAIGWIRADLRRSLAVGVGGVAVLALVAFAGGQLRHPSVSAAEQAADWSATNSALAQVVAADLRWQAAPAPDRAARVTEVRAATRLFADSVNLLERIRPPEEGLQAHRATTAVYRNMAELLDLLPGALATEDTGLAAAIWRSVGTLSDEAASFVDLTTPR